MIPNTRNGMLLLGSCLMLAALPSCLPEESYESCRLPPEQKVHCVGEGKTLNCLVEHPSCPDNYCVSWQGSDSFCSKACKKNTDCPDNGCCVPFLLGCEDPTKIETCPSLCVDRAVVANGTCPSSELPPTDPGIDLALPDLSAVVEDVQAE